MYSDNSFSVIFNWIESLSYYAHVLQRPIRKYISRSVVRHSQLLYNIGRISRRKFRMWKCVINFENRLQAYSLAVVPSVEFGISKHGLKTRISQIKIMSNFPFSCVDCSGVLVPGGFGIRGTLGKLQAISWARSRKIPFLGKTDVYESWVWVFLDFWYLIGITHNRVC